MLTRTSHPDAANHLYGIPQGDPRVYLLNVETGQREIVGNSPACRFAAVFLPDGRHHEPAAGGNSNLFVMDLRSSRPRAPTDTPAIDTCLATARRRPDLFQSDRASQIYVMAATGAAHFVRRRQLFDCVSPRGDYIAFTKKGGGQFSIAPRSPTARRGRSPGFRNDGRPSRRTAAC